MTEGLGGRGGGGWRGGTGQGWSADYIYDFIIFEKENKNLQTEKSGKQN